MADNSDGIITTDDEVQNMSLLPLVYFAIEKGIPSAVLKAEIGVDVTAIDSSNFKLSVHNYKRLIELTKEYTGLAHPGLHVGNRMSIKSLGILGYVMASCNSLGEAIQKFYEYNRISQNVGTFYLKIKGDYVKYYYPRMDHPLEDIEAFLMDAFATCFFSVGHELTGADIKPEKTCFCYPQPDDLTDYKRFIKGELEFDCDFIGIYYPKQYNDLPIKFPNAELLHVFEKLARQSLKELSTEKNYSDKVIQILSRRLSNLPDVAETARKLGVSSRNLQQKLQLEETTFNDLRTLTRTRFARNYLLSSNYPAYEVGYLLGYSEPSVFYRAFKQWTGQTPNEFRSLNAIPVESSG